MRPGVPAGLRRPLFGPHGRIVVGVFCGWELVALPPGSPVPTISEVVKRHPFFGAVLLSGLIHHWYLEMEHLEMAQL